MEEPCSVERPGARRGALVVACFHQALQRVQAVAVVAADEPEEDERACEAQTLLGTSRRGRVPLERGAQVLVVGRQLLQHDVLLGPCQRWPGVFCEHEVMSCVAVT